MNPIAKLLLIPALCCTAGCLTAAPEPVTDAATALEVLDFVSKVEKAASPKGKKVTAIRLRHRGEIPANKIRFSTLSCFKSPDRMSIEVALPGMLPTLELFDGKEGWKITQYLGIKRETGRQLDFMRLQAQLGNPTAKLNEIFTKITLDRKTADINGVPCRRLVCEWPEAIKLAPMELWFDNATLLLRRSVMATPTGFGDIAVTTDYDKYKEFSGIMLPVWQKGDSLGMLVEMTLIQCDINPDLPDAMFKPKRPEDE